MADTISIIQNLMSTPFNMLFKASCTNLQINDVTMIINFLSSIVTFETLFEFAH